ncbi:ABC-type transport auxiliary lipoprotein family protein [Pseudooceanicola sp.]|uniref:PqiC family protein n=1 Tax=Pseudooceanicola sp. TaxID=1914328 RepID=UPI002617D8BE|nr:ABC-type transport auxiliary lipoprotein family protein [Pseudooceanicola sp.]MDF1856020.1 ABC-type transport auxiliary lipoprotein family protein [Pseudooceanicola sp.]
MRYPILHAVLALSLLTACSGESSQLYSVPPAVVSGEKMRISYRSVELVEVSLPAYAASEEIHRRGNDGALTAQGGLLWSDAPARAVTLELARYLAQMTSARVAPEPWPFADRAAVRVDVRVEEMFADGDMLFRMSGQYFVAPDAGGRDRSGLFSLSAPIAPGGGVAAVAAARGEVVRDLARDIAKDGLR